MTITDVDFVLFCLGLGFLVGFFVGVTMVWMVML